MSNTQQSQAGSKAQSGRKVPSWLVVLVALVTAGATAWAMLYRNTGAWTGDSPFQPEHVTRVLYPGVAGMSPAQPGQQNGGGFRLIARPMAGGAPTITMSATMPHADRGPCTHCHAVVSNEGTPMPQISAVAQMPHRYYGGVCANCHLMNSQAPRGPAPTGVAGAAGWPNTAQGVARPNWQGQVQGQGQQRGQQIQGQHRWVHPGAQGGQNGGWGNQNAGQWQANNQRLGGFRQLAAPPAAQPNGMAGVPGPQGQPQQAQAPKPPPEVEWLGLEVAPITKVTAAQFGIPPGLNGIVITDVEAQAAAAGLMPGDLLVAINGRQIPNLATFNQVVQLGKLNWGMVDVRRKGKMIRVPLRKVAPAPTAPGQMAPGQMVPGQMVPGQMVPGQMIPGAPVIGGNPQAFAPGTLQGSVPGQPVGLRRNAGSATQGF